jgi:hypothetical protein
MANNKKGPDLLEIQAFLREPVFYVGKMEFTT